MKTVRKLLELQRAYHRRQAHTCTETLSTLEKRFPALLDFEASVMYLLSSSPGVCISPSAWDKTEQKGFFGRAMEVLEKRLGTSTADLEVDSWGKSLEVEIPSASGRGKSFSVHFSRSVDKKCRKARVTHVIEVCGEVDETQYDSVEYITEAETR